jgi:N-acetylmuramoyl-L-alanine amidase
MPVIGSFMQDNSPRYSCRQTMQVIAPGQIERLLATLWGRGSANESTVKGLHMQRFRLLLISVFSFGLLATPADAGQLASWKFDPTRNRLDFKTDAGVQPKAVLLFNPTRLVIDLPGISFPKSTITQKLTGNFRSLRVGQFDGGTARLVLELQPGYTLNPKRVQFTGENPIDWYVNIPVPERGSTTLPTLSPRPTNSPR